MLNVTSPASSLLRVILLAPALVFGLGKLHAATTVGPWVPKFKGVDFSVSTNTPGGDFPHRQVVFAFRVDLTDPDIRLLTTPRRSDYVEGLREIGGLTVTEFLRTNHVQAAINANFFDARSYYLPAGYPMDVYGLSISEGVVVSPQDDAGHAAALLFDANNQASIISDNWPGTNTSGIFTAVAGNYPLVIDGKSVVSRTGRLETDPRTAFGLSQDRRYLYLIGIDGRQPGYSDGAYDYETAGWLLLLGAYDGVNMDGGGSTTLVMEGSTGAPVRLNHPSAVADSGRERTVGSHFGIFAKPLPGFINDVSAVPDDTTATIAWSTLQPATSQVEYGLTEAMGSDSGEQTALVTNHLVQLTGLTPNTGYYYRLISMEGSSQHVSSNYFFMTTNYVTTNLVIDITNSWKHSVTPQNSQTWTTSAYDDSSWGQPEPGLLWVDVRSAGPNPSVEPKNTRLATDPDNDDYPYITYYFRSHFTVPNLRAGSSLALSGFIDDGAVVYLNGIEIWRVRMPEETAADTLATGYACEGDATCLDEQLVPASSLGSLVAGDNVLAVEVHNYNVRSSDMTFGLAASLIQPISRDVTLSIDASTEAIILRWDATGFTLQSAESLGGPWSNETLTSPATIGSIAAKRFYRLQK